ncbi:type I glutamate--ammonia ligase [Stetteria hydrogenophila]
MAAPGAEEVLTRIRRDGVEWINLQFTDLLGYFRQVTIHKRLLDAEAFEEGLGKLDGSSVRGFAGIQESDLVLKPVPGTYAKLPWAERAARLISRVYKPGGRERLPRDPAYALERAVSYAAEAGFEVKISAELEFHVFKDISVKLEPYESGVRIESAEILREGNPFFLRQKEAYFTVEPYNSVMEFEVKLGRVLEEYFGIPVEVFHHEVSAGGQVEVNWRYSDPITTADRLQTIKYAARNVARELGYVAVFLPKPIPSDNGNGLHVHLSLWSGGRNTFYDPSDSYAELSQVGRYFIGGLLEHGRAVAAFTNPTVNSYRRLIPGFEAPVYLVWGKANRSAAVRVPFYFPGDEKGRRIEFRSPDPTANPYLAFTAIIMAGLDGVKKKIDPGDPIDENVYAMGEAKRRALGIKSLPRSLDEALDELESDNEWLKPAVDRELLEEYIELKREEARSLAAYASAAEYAFYLSL